MVKGHVHVANSAAPSSIQEQVLASPCFGLGDVPNSFEHDIACIYVPGEIDTTSFRSMLIHLRQGREDGGLADQMSRDLEP